jgi:DNA-binding transcriptional ArsR family regulator
MEDNCCSSLEQLSRKSGMSLPLISYHINGTPKSHGLKEMGLVETEDIGGRVNLRLTRLGQVLVKGYIK